MLISTLEAHAPTIHACLLECPTCLNMLVQTVKTHMFKHIPIQTLEELHV